MRIFVTFGIVVTMLALIGCGGSNEPTKTTEPADATIVSPTATQIPTPTSVPIATQTPIPPTAAPTQIPTPVPDAPDCPAAQSVQNPPGDVPPNIFLGTATIDGAPAPAGSVVTSCIDGEPVAFSVVSEGKFLLTIHQRIPSLIGKEVIFSIDGVDAKETAVWAIGGAILIDLTAER